MTESEVPEDWPDEPQPKGYPDDFAYTIRQVNGAYVIHPEGEKKTGEYVASDTIAKDIYDKIE